MKVVMTSDYYTQHMQCTRDEKLNCLPIVRDLIFIGFTVRDFGLLKLDDMIHDTMRYRDRFLRRAAGLIVESADMESIEDVLYNLIFNSSNMTNSAFFRSVLIAEVMMAIGRGEDMDYIFAYLVPSFFGLEYVEQVEKLYYQCKREYMSGGKAERQAEDY